jgi:hypothetical protein
MGVCRAVPPQYMGAEHLQRYILLKTSSANTQG